MQPLTFKTPRKSATTFDMKPGTKEYEQFFVDDLNKMAGNENEKDGYNCNICNNKAWVVKVVEYPKGTYGKEYGDCKCAEIRRSIMRMKRSGLKDIIKDSGFSTLHLSAQNVSFTHSSL